ncbi:MAG: hypothetical protein HYZ74_07710 [Elusimicrobia bacterium]|nr:hypothetical protein [Elusimicrobiota bacterium]
MRPPRALAVFASLALASCASAEVQTRAATEVQTINTGAAGSSLHSGPTSLSNASLTMPVSPSGTTRLAPPAPVPEALVNAPLAANQGTSFIVKPHRAQAVSAATASVPRATPQFQKTLVKLGVPTDLAQRLGAFIAARHPGESDKVYHGLAHSEEVADLASWIVEDLSIPVERKILIILSAALHDIDPERPLYVGARVSATVAYLSANPEAHALVAAFTSRYGFTAAQVDTLILATDFSIKPDEMAAKQKTFTEAAAGNFGSDEAWALDWGRKLAFIDQTATYIDSPGKAVARIANLSFEFRTQNKASVPTEAQLLSGSYGFLSNLRSKPLYAMLPRPAQERFQANLDYFKEKQTPAAWAAVSVSAPAVDIEGARRYVARALGANKPAPGQIQAILTDWFRENTIDPSSAQAQAVIAVLLSGMESLVPGN